MGNRFYATTPVPQVAVELISKYCTDCSFSFDSVKHVVDAGCSHTTKVTLPIGCTAITVIGKSLISFPIVSEDKVRTLFNFDSSECLHVTVQDDVWCCSFFGERTRIKIMNKTNRCVTIMRLEGDPLVVSPQSFMEAKQFTNLVTADGTTVNIKGCYYLDNGEPRRRQYYHHDGLEFDCHDDKELVTVTVRVAK